MINDLKIDYHDWNANNLIVHLICYSDDLAIIFHNINIQDEQPTQSQKK